MSALRPLVEHADAWSLRLARAMTALSAIAVALIVVVLVFASLQRYVLSSPIPATEEIAGYLFVAMSFLAMVGGMVERRHIRVLIVWRLLPVRLQAWTMLAGHLGAIVVLGILFWQTFGFARSSFQFGARSYVADLLEWPWMMLIPVSLALLALAVAVRSLADLDRALDGEPTPEATAADEGAA
ncbi:MAG: TRAP transporter small permease [Burkholderiaceae bacterium]|nr:TRAP transporter small permease [Burkholderiaceae bacterium]